MSGTGAVLLLLTGCSPDAVEVAPVSQPTAAIAPCRALLADLPARVESGSSRAVTPDSVAGAAWGDPPIVLRCGVGKPAGQTASSSCMEVNGVGWFADKRADGYVFTTIGRAANVELTVPADYAPESNALVDVAAAVTKHIPAREPCL